MLNNLQHTFLAFAHLLGCSQDQGYWPAPSNIEYELKPTSKVVLGLFPRLAVERRNEHQHPGSNTVIFILPLLVIIYSLFFFSSQLAFAQTDAQFKPERAQTAFRDSVSDNDLQTNMGLRREFETEYQESSRKVIPSEVIIGLMIFFAIGLIVILIRYYRNWSTKEAKEEKVEEKTEPIDTTKLLQAGQQADELAKHNNIIEAMHTLLLDTIQELKNQKKQTFPDSFTSREIASKLNIGTAANKALDEIVTIVEPTWFGNYLPALTEYKVLRKKYDTFLLLLGGRKQPEL